VNTILDALDDPNVFAPHFRGNTWRPWRAFLAALFALPMDDDALALYRAHTGRQDAPTQPFKEAALIIGRRGGKSRVLALIATYLATFRDYVPFLAPGEAATIAIIASDRRQARSIFRFTIGLLKAVDMLAGMVEDDTTDTITLTNRVVIEIATASFRVTRGYSFAAVLADETAWWRSEDSAAPDTEIFRALRPGLSTIPGAMLLNASSPYRKRGVLHDAYKRHYGRDDGRVLVWQASSQAMNPGLDAAEIAEAYEDDPEAAASEYGGEFRSDLADFVSRDVVDACTVRGRHEMPRVAGCYYQAFVDPSGGSADSMTLAIAHVDSKDRQRRILDAVREVKPPFSPEAVVAEFAELLKLYGIRTVTGDAYAGEYPRELFRKQGITYKVSELSKGAIYLNTLPLLNARRVELLDVPRLASQLCGLERRTARGGKDSIDHGPGAHDDLGNAACGALLLAALQRPSMAVSNEALAMITADPSRRLRFG